MNWTLAAEPQIIKDVAEYYRLLITVTNGVETKSQFVWKFVDYPAEQQLNEQVTAALNRLNS